MRQSQRFELERLLTERDKAVIETLSRLRLATTQQLKTLHFPDVSEPVYYRALGRLRRLGVLHALSWQPEPAQRSVRHKVYQLASVGQALVTTAKRRILQPTDYGALYITHALGITDVYVALTRAKTVTELLFITEPACWRGKLHPDAYIQFVSGKFRYYWFLEMDMATEEPKRIKQKLDAYMRYHQSGQEQRHYKIFPKVLFLVPDENRKTQIQTLIDRHPTRKLSRAALQQNSLTALTGGPSL